MRTDQSSEAMSPRKVRPKSNVGIAASYVRRLWTVLTEFTGDASIPIDNNDCEQLMKRVATGCQNWLFKGSPVAGERAANLMTIIVSAMRNELDVHAYVDDVLRRALAGETDWSAMAPRAWKMEHPESIRVYREQIVCERRIRAPYTTGGFRGIISRLPDSSLGNGIPPSCFTTKSAISVSPLTTFSCCPPTARWCPAKSTSAASSHSEFGCKSR
jgi:hypothetical protein